MDRRELESAQDQVTELESEVQGKRRPKALNSSALLESIQSQHANGHVIGDLFRGAKSSSPPAFLVYPNSVASIEDEIPCKSGSFSPFDGVFECSSGNALVDFRFACH